MGRVHRVLALILAAALVATFVAACSPGSYSVSLSVKPRVEGGTLVIEGETSLPAGARLRYVATSRVATWQSLSGWVACSQNRFRTGESISNWPAGDAAVTVTFDPGSAGQPSELRDRCGKNGRLLTGPGVVKRGRVKVVEARATVWFPGRLALRAAKPAVEPAAVGTGDTVGVAVPGPDITTVYVTRTGEKYHRPGCQYLSKSCSPLGLSLAKSRGYSPCSICRPPP